MPLWPLWGQGLSKLIISLCGCQENWLSSWIVDELKSIVNSIVASVNVGLSIYNGVMAKSQNGYLPRATYVIRVENTLCVNWLGKYTRVVASDNANDLTYTRDTSVLLYRS